MSDATESARPAETARPPRPTSQEDAVRTASLAAAYDVTLRAVTAIVGTVVALTFIFGFGNVWTLGLRLGVPGWVAPLVAPAVDLSILGLLLGIRHLALHGATPAELRPARRLLIFASAVTLALNVADPLIAGMVGKAAFDAVGPLLLIAWAEVGPGFLQAISAASARAGQSTRNDGEPVVPTNVNGSSEQPRFEVGVRTQGNRSTRRTRSTQLPQWLIERARQEDAAHRAVHQKPISADTLRARLNIGANRSRRLVEIVRSEVRAKVSGYGSQAEGAADVVSANTTCAA